MSNALTQRLEQLGRHRAVVGAGQFLRWWRDELVDSLPEDWKARLRTEQERLEVRLDGEQAVIANQGGEELGAFEISAEPAVAVQTVQGVLARSDESRPEIVALLGGERVLRRIITLPAATADNLRQVLTFEMDRHTPFKADDVWFDYRILESVSGGARIRVELFLARREEGERVAGFCSDRGLQLHGIDAADAVEGTLGINLLPPGQRAVRDRRLVRLNIALAIGFVVLLNVVLWQSVATRERAMEDYQARLASIRAEAAEVIALRDELEATAAASSFLADKKSSSPPVLDLLGELTSRLPDDTWLQRMQVNGDVVQISGQAPAAAELVALLEQSACLEGPNIKGAVTPDPQNGKERFTIEAQIRGACVDGAASS